MVKGKQQNQRNIQKSWSGRKERHRERLVIEQVKNVD